MLLFPDTGELVLEDAPQIMNFQKNDRDGFIVVVDIDTGTEVARAPFHEKGTMGMFLTPGWARDFYCCSIEGTVARFHVAPVDTSRL